MSATTLLLLIVGLVALVAGAEGLVRGAARLAARTGMSSVVIGLTVVAFGTSAPELAVSVGDSIRGGEEAGSIAIGNVVGSNIANILLVLGIAAATGGALFVAQRIVRIDVRIMIGVSVLFFVLVLDERLSRLEGLVLVVVLVSYITWTVIAATRGSTPADVAEYDEALDPEKLAASPVFVDLGYLVGGLALLVVGAQALVSSASDIASDLGVSDLVIGLTVVAIGTSLPEVATSVMAAMRGERDLAVGNAIGSNLFNIMAVLGITALVSPNALPVAASAIRVDIPVMIAVAIVCLPVFANGHVLNRWEGLVFLTLYIGYLVWLVLDANGHGLRDAYASAMVLGVVPVVGVTIMVLWARGRSRPAWETGR
jgi:cation:H+ antiporter